MSNRDKIKDLKDQYNNIEIPKELDNMVKNMTTTKKFSFGFAGKTGIAAAVIMAMFTSAVNISPAFAESMADIPVVGSIVKLVTIKTYTAKDGNMEAKIDVAQIEGLENKELEKELNEKFIKEGQKEYSNFKKDMEELKTLGGGNMAMETSYQVKADTDTVYSIVYTKYIASGSSNTEYKSYTIDKKNQAVVTLNSLFKDSSYIDIISDYIKKDMREQMKTDESKSYFIDDEEIGDENFNKIKADQTFYINNDGKLVILFNKYDVAPGYMGTPEFVIPSETLKGVLLDRGLIK